MLELSTTKATPRMAERLAVLPGTRLVRLRRLITKNGTAAIYQSEYVLFDAQKPLIESQLQLSTFDGILQPARGSGFSRGRISLTAVTLDEEAADVLRVPAGSAALCMDHVFEDGTHRPVGWGRLLARADMFELLAQVGME